MATKKKAEAPAPAVKEEPKTVKRAPAKKCEHAWIGAADGVTCTKCGLHLTADEFAKEVK